MRDPFKMMSRLAVLCDFRDEGWPSMDLVADMLLAEFQNGPSGVEAARVCPAFHPRLCRVPGQGDRGAMRNADRLLNRFWDYPQYVRRRVAGHFDLYHIADHSYSHLVHSLPANRTGVYCHDLDTFRCLLKPELEPRPRWFRAMAKRILTGMQKAAVVFHSTQPVREQILQFGLIEPRRLVHAPYGISREFCASAVDPEPAATLLPDALQSRPFLLHVGSCIPRKRIDVLLDVFAAVKTRRPELHLVQVGGDWTDAQLEQARRLGIESNVTRLRRLSREQIASLYRSAAVVLQPSEAEGFGLPVIEALACGASVVASDIPVLREVGGPAAVYRPVGDIETWAEAVQGILADPTVAPPISLRLDWSGRYSWGTHARTIADSYIGLLGRTVEGPKVSGDQAPLSS